MPRLFAYAAVPKDPFVYNPLNRVTKFFLFSGTRISNAVSFRNSSLCTRIPVSLYCSLSETHGFLVSMIPMARTRSKDSGTGFESSRLVGVLIICYIHNSAHGSYGSADAPNSILAFWSPILSPESV